MILALRQIGYGFEHAIADLIDNSVNAGASNVLVRFVCDSERLRCIIIADDGQGMSERELHHAMRFGASNNPVPESLGKYGMGLKLASLSFAQTLTVISRRNGAASGRRWNIQGIERGWECEVLASDDAARYLAAPWGPISLAQRGTLVFWDDIDKLPLSSAGLKATIRQLATRLQVHLGLCFHRFIQSHALSIFLDQQFTGQAERSIRLEINPLDPFGYPVSGSKDFPQKFRAWLPDIGPLELEAHIWPPNSDLPQYKLGNKAASRQGFYFYRNGRLIQAGGWNGIVQHDSEPHGSLARVAIDLPSSYDHAFGLNVQKSTVIVPPGFDSAVATARTEEGLMFDAFRRAAVNTYRRRDARAERARPAVPADGLPRQVADVAKLLLAPGEPRPRRVGFEWQKLPPDEFFQLDRKRRIILINSLHRKQILRGRSSSRTDAPLLKVLLFLLVADDLDSNRVSNLQKRRIERSSRLLACAAMH